MSECVCLEFNLDSNYARKILLQMKKLKLGGGWGPTAGLQPNQNSPPLSDTQLILLLLVPNLFDTRDQLHGRQFFHRLGRRELFWDDSGTLHLLCTLFLLLLYQLHLWSSSIGSQRLGTPTSLNHLALCPLLPCLVFPTGISAFRMAGYSFPRPLSNPSGFAYDWLWKCIALF